MIGEACSMLRDPCAALRNRPSPSAPLEEWANSAVMDQRHQAGGGHDDQHGFGAPFHERSRCAQRAPDRAACRLVPLAQAKPDIHLSFSVKPSPVMRYGVSSQPASRQLPPGASKWSRAAGASANTATPHPSRKCDSPSTGRRPTRLPRLSTPCNDPLPTA